MKNKGKTKRLMWMTTAACAMMFLGMGICLICGLRAARESIEESCKRDMEVVMEQLEKPYATRLNTSDELTETMERYLFSQGRQLLAGKQRLRFKFCARHSLLRAAPEGAFSKYTDLSL